MKLGTILPTRQSLAIGAAVARRTAKEQQQTAKQLQRYTKKIVCGEVRYYDGPTKYAVVSRRDTSKILWFEQRTGGDWFAVKNERART